eukprot:TRINITY_DN4870_c0_g1_i1.p1 TRINITY_DN4870_c0_g1~~TRINITY_DN4870_c0_g1_i1.p1  ORF type:complete len:1060 (+),score=117.99 TRINITY_DN4870_c0_g1_i1:769-3948(+)
MQRNVLGKDLFDELHQQAISRVLAPVGKKRKVSPVLQRHNIEMFKENKGFELVIELARLGEKCSLSLMLDFLEPVTGTLHFLKEETSLKISEELLILFEIRLATLSEIDLKEIEYASIDQMYNVLKDLNNAADSKEAALTKIAKISIQLMNTSYIQKKLLGLSTIKDMLPKKTEQTGYELRSPEKLFKEPGLVETILGENANAEIIRKADTIFGYMLESGKFDTKHLEMLWKCCQEKHEGIIRASLDLLLNSLPKMQYKLLHELFEKIGQMALISETSMVFLRDYTEKVLQIITEREGRLLSPLLENMTEPETSKKKGPEIDKYKMYDLELFWKVFQDTTKSPGKIKDLAITGLAQILKKFPALADMYIQKAVESIKCEDTLVRSIQLLKEIDFTNIKGVKGKDFTYDLKGMNERCCIIKNVIKSCENYHMNVKKELDSKGFRMADAMNMVIFIQQTTLQHFGTGFTFARQAALYLAFLEYFCSKGHISLLPEDVLVLWECYVQHGICEAHSDMLFNIVTKESKDPKDSNRFTLFQDKVAKVFFDQILCAASSVSAKLTENGFECFKKYMEWANEKDFVPGREYTNIQGLDSLWGICFESPYEQLQNKAKDYLVDVIEQQCDRYKQKRRDIIANALETALSNANKDLTSTAKIKTALKIIAALIERIERLKVEDVGPEYSALPLMDFEIYRNGSESFDKISINENMKLSHLKSLLSSVYKVNKSLIVLRKHPEKEVIDESYDYYLSNLKRVTGNKLIVEILSLGIPVKETPRFLLANSGTFGQLLQLLKAPSENVVNEVWELMMCLPINESFRNKLVNLVFAKGKVKKGWAEFLGISKDYESVELVYYLYVLNEIHHSTEEGIEYMRIFMKKGGVAFLLSVFDAKKKSIRVKLNTTCLEYIIRLVTLYLNPDTYSVVFPNIEDSLRIWNDVLDLMGLINYSQSSDTKMNLKTQIILFDVCCSFHEAIANIDLRLISQINNEKYQTTLKQCTSLLQLTKYRLFPKQLRAYFEKNERIGLSTLQTGKICRRSETPKRFYWFAHSRFLTTRTKMLQQIKSLL